MSFLVISTSIGGICIKENEEVICSFCGDKISNREDLVVLSDFLRVKAYHNNCYAEMMKSAAISSKAKPINSKLSNLSLFVLGILVLVVFFYADSWFPKAAFALMMVAGTVGRLESWFKFEKKL